MFLIRAAFWLGVVVLLIPAEPSTDKSAPEVSAFQAIGAARDAVADMTSFCDRNPNVCVTGSAMADLMARKARYGARKVGEYLEAYRNGNNAGAADRGTLTVEDTQAPWQPPKARMADLN